MAVTLTMTGTSQSISAINASPNITFTAGVAANWVVGATVQGAGWATGTKIQSITGTPATATAAVLSNNFTGTTGAASVIVSSNNATAIFALTASGDTATPQNIINLGLGSTPTGLTNAIQIFGRTYIEFQFAQGATFDDTEWTYFLGLYSYMRANETYTGTWRSGWKLQGSTYIRAKGATIYYQQARAVQGGTAMFTNSGIPAGFPTNKFKAHWHDIAWIGMSGSNYGMVPQMFYGEWYQCGDIICDYWGDSGANGSFAGSYGSIEKLSMLKVIGGIGGGYDATTVTPIGKIEWFCIANGDTTGANPDIKLGTPNNVPVSGLAPIFYQTNTSLTFIGVNTNNTEIWDDYVLPNNYPLITNSRNYSAGNRTYRRTVTFTLKDSAATALTGATVYVKSGSTTLVNAVQVGDFSQKLRTVWVDWTSRSPASGSYIAPIQSIDNRIHTAQIRKYGYQQQSVTYDLTNSAYSQPFFMLAEPTLASMSDPAVAAANTTAGINWATQTITPTGNQSYDTLNARIAYELAQTTGSAYADPRTISGTGLSLATGWMLVANNGITISSGTAITSWYTPTITLNGTGAITGVYSTSVGTSVIREFTSLASGVGSSLCVFNASGTTLLYKNNPNSTERLYLAPASPVTLYARIRQYGKKPQYFTFSTSVTGLTSITASYIDDVGISQPTLATVQAYSQLEFNSKVYDYYNAWALAEQGMKLGDVLVRDGTAINAGSYSGKVKATASSLFNITGSLVTIKAPSLAGDSKFDTIIATPPATWTADTTEVITTNIEDGNGDSSIDIEASGVSTFEIWKITDATPPDDYATGTLLATVGIGKWRFLHVDGYKVVIRDTTTNFRVVESMSKGNTMAELFFGSAVQLAQAPEVTQINSKVTVLQNELTAIKGAGFDGALDSLEAIRVAVDAKPALADIEASTILANKDDVLAVTANVWSAETRTLTDSLATASQVTALGEDVLSIASVVMDLPSAADNASAVRTELSAELGHLDADISSRSTLTAQDIPEGLTAAEVWAATDRTLTETLGLPTTQAEQLRKVAQLHGVGAELVVTATSRTAGDVSQTITSTEDQTTVSSA